MPVRVTIVEDDHVTRESLAALVQAEPGLELLATYPDAESAIVHVPLCPPDVVVVDMGLAPAGSGRLDGAGCVAELKKSLPDLRALMLTVYDDHDIIVRGLRAGASGYILKRSPPDEILAAIKLISQGGTPLSMLVAMQLVHSFHGTPASGPQPTAAVDGAASAGGVAGLAPVEQQILALVAAGAEESQIAARVGLPLLTVRSYLHSIFAQLGVQNRTQAAVIYFESRLQAPPGSRT